MLIMLSNIPSPPGALVRIADSGNECTARSPGPDVDVIGKNGSG